MTLSKSPASPIAGSVSTAPMRADRHRLLAEQPARHVEVVDRHVAEDAARPPDVVDRRRARVARGDVDHLDRADAPSSIALRTARKCGSKRRLKPTISLRAGRLDHLQARLHPRRRRGRSASRRRSPCRPPAKRSIRSAWVSVGVQITTASTSPAASIASIARTSAPYCRGQRLRRRRHRVGDRDEPRVRIAGDGAGVHLADAPGAEQAETNSHSSLALRRGSRRRRLRRRRRPWPLAAASSTPVM